MAGLGSAYARLSGNTRGVIWMLGSALSFAAMTTLIKFLGADYSAPLQTFYRQAAGLIVLAPIILRDPVGAYRTTRPGILIFRAGAGTLGLILAFYSYQKMPLAEANALSFTRTLWLVPLAAFVLGEAVGPRRIGAALVGFAGVLLMLRPATASGVGLPAAAALGSALLLALTITGMKVMTRDHSARTLMAWAATLGFVFALPGAFFSWRWPAPFDLFLLGVMGVLGTVTQWCYIKGMSLGDAGLLAPVDYTRLVFTVIVGLVVFHEAPDVMTMLGAAIVIGSTLYITIREARIGARAPPPTSEGA